MTDDEGGRSLVIRAVQDAAGSFSSASTSINDTVTYMALVVACPAVAPVTRHSLVAYCYQTSEHRVNR